MGAYDTLAKYFDREMVPPIRQQIIGRPLFGKTVPLPRGKYSVDYLALSEMSEAMLSRSKPDPNLARDNVEATLSNVALVFISKGYKIPKQMYDTFASEGVMLDQSAMMSAAYRCARAEDNLILNGWTPDGSTVEVYGLYNGAGNDYSTSATFDTYGNASKAVAGGLALNSADGINGMNYNLLLNPVEWYKLQKSVSNGDWEIEHVKKILNPNPSGPQGQIIQTDLITAGTGLLSPIDMAGLYMDLVMVDYENDIGVDSRSPKNSPIYGAIVGGFYTRIKQANALCKLSSIT